MWKRQPVPIAREGADQDAGKGDSPMADKKVFGHDERGVQSAASLTVLRVLVCFELCNLQKEGDQASRTHTASEK